MAFEGRTVELGDQIHCAEGPFFFAGLRSWQAASQRRLMDSRIPQNKVRNRSFKLCFSGQAQLCSVVPLLAAVFPWWKPKAVKVCALDGFVNKAQSLVLVG